MEDLSTKSLFDLANQSDLNLQLDPAEALMAIAMLAVAADGKLSEAEKPELKANYTRIFGHYTLEKFELTERHVWQLVVKYSSATVFAAAKQSLNKNLKETAFAIATDLVLADGAFTPNERKFLADLWNALDISDEMGQNIIDVMVIKNCRLRQEILS